MLEMLRESIGHHPVARALGAEMPWELWILLMLAIIAATTVHEFGHAWMADRLGDPGPREAGRVTLNPLKHLDPLGTLLMGVTLLIGFPIGWGKPVKTDPTRYTTSPRTGMAWVAAAGPAMNLALAIALAPVVRWFLGGGAPEELPWLMWIFIASILTMLINLSLFCFNLVPVHPLDGSHILAALLPEKEAASYQEFMQRYGVFVLLLLLITGALGKIIGPLVMYLFLLLIGG